mmetsp:Transcript_1389/g.4439  ORF Transcript_1389/g.4439 Transcript_1389/m.4439 type:complete len:241 (+) Transcript_1389:551-1273(+)
MVPRRLAIPGADARVSGLDHLQRNRPAASAGAGCRARRACRRLCPGAGSAFCARAPLRPRLDALHPRASRRVAQAALVLPGAPDEDAARRPPAPAQGLRPAPRRRAAVLVPPPSAARPGGPAAAATPGCLFAWRARSHAVRRHPRPTGRRARGRGLPAHLPHLERLGPAVRPAGRMRTADPAARVGRVHPTDALRSEGCPRRLFGKFGGHRAAGGAAGARARAGRLGSFLRPHLFRAVFG